MKKSMCDVSVTVIATKCKDQLKKKKLCTFILGTQSQLNLIMGKIAKLFKNCGNLNILRIICIKSLIIFENSK